MAEKLKHPIKNNICFSKSNDISPFFSEQKQHQISVNIHHVTGIAPTYDFL